MFVGLEKRRVARGASSVSYIILVGVVALGTLGTWQAFGKKVGEKTKAQGGVVEDVGPGGPIRLPLANAPPCCGPKPQMLLR